jgi:hypothetical protein
MDVSPVGNVEVWSRKFGGPLNVAHAELSFESVTLKRE